MCVPMNMMHAYILKTNFCVCVLLPSMMRQYILYTKCMLLISHCLALSATTAQDNMKQTLSSSLHGNTQPKQASSSHVRCTKSARRVIYLMFPRLISKGQMLLRKLLFNRMCLTVWAIQDCQERTQDLLSLTITRQSIVRLVGFHLPKHLPFVARKLQQCQSRHFQNTGGRSQWDSLHAHTLTILVCPYRAVCSCTLLCKVMGRICGGMC